MAKTPRFHCRGHRFHFQLGQKTKIPHATWHSGGRKKIRGIILILNSLRLVLCLTIWFTLENVPCVAENTDQNKQPRFLQNPAHSAPSGTKNWTENSGCCLQGLHQAEERGLGLGKLKHHKILLSGFSILFLFCFSWWSISLACLVIQLCPALKVHGLWPTRLSVWNFPGKNTEVGCHFLLQGIFLTQGSNPSLLRLLHGRWILYHWAIGKPRRFSSCCKILVSIQSSNKASSDRFASLVRDREMSRWRTGHFCAICPSLFTLFVIIDMVGFMPRDFIIYFLFSLPLFPLSWVCLDCLNISLSIPVKCICCVFNYRSLFLVVTLGITRYIFPFLGLLRIDIFYHFRMKN